MNYESLSKQLLRALRGRRSQVAFSRRLKYKSNVAYLWESGRNWPTAATFLWAATRVGVDITAAISSFYRDAPKWLGETEPATREGVATLLDDLRGDTPVLELAEKVGRNRYAVSRWLKGQAEPRLPDFLKLMEATSSRLLDFVSQFCDVNKLAAAREPWKQLSAARRMIGQLPWSPAVLLVLQTEGYRNLPEHKPGWIANRLGLPPEVEVECLELLATTGQIQMVGKRWQVAQVQAIDTRTDPDAGRRLKSWWAKVGLDHIAKDAPGLYSYNVFSISQADLERLEDMHRAYYRALRAVVAASEPSERVVVANVQLFALDAAG